MQLKELYHSMPIYKFNNFFLGWTTLLRLAPFALALPTQWLLPLTFGIYTFKNSLEHYGCSISDIVQTFYSIKQIAAGQSNSF